MTTAIVLWEAKPIVHQTAILLHAQITVDIDPHRVGGAHRRRTQQTHMLLQADVVRGAPPIEEGTEGAIGDGLGLHHGDIHLDGTHALGRLHLAVGDTLDPLLVGQGLRFL